MHSSTIKTSILGAIGGIALAATLNVSAYAGEKLSFFTWTGYELPEFDKSFLAAHPDGVDVTVFGEDDDAFAKVKAGFNPDIAHPCYDKISRWSKEGLIQPIDTSRIKNWNSIFPVFKDLPDIQAGDGKVWMVPWDWGNVSVLYRTDLIKNPEQSWNLLWNKQFAGRIATLDTVHDTVVVAAILAGVNPFDMTPADMEKVADKLRQQRPLLRNYTTDMTSVEQSLASGELVAAMTWNASAHTLKKQGAPVEFMQPKEGMLTWTCGFVLLKNSKNIDLAYDFINSRLEPESGKELIDQYSYGSTSSATFNLMSKEELEQTHLPSDPEILLKTTKFSQPMRQIDDVAKMFEKIKAGG